MNFPKCIFLAVSAEFRLFLLSLGNIFRNLYLTDLGEAHTLVAPKSSGS